MVVGEDDWDRVAGSSGDFGICEEVLELFGAGHAEGGEAVSGSASADGDGAWEPVHIKEGGVRAEVSVSGDGFLDGGGDFPSRN